MSRWVVARVEVFGDEKFTDDNIADIVEHGIEAGTAEYYVEDDDEDEEE